MKWKINPYNNRNNLIFSQAVGNIVSREIPMRNWTTNSIIFQTYTCWESVIVTIIKCQKHSNHWSTILLIFISKSKEKQILKYNNDENKIAYIFIKALY